MQLCFIKTLALGALILFCWKSWKEEAGFLISSTLDGKLLALTRSWLESNIPLFQPVTGKSSINKDLTMNTRPTLLIFCFFCLLASTFARPGGSSFGGVFQLEEAPEDSEYAFDIGNDEFETMRSWMKYDSYLNRIRRFMEHMY